MKITLAMIVKNEEGGLKRCVDSCKDIVDEVVIGVDKNSTDKTLEIAKEIADVCYEYEWEDDFAKARNTYLGKATGDWIIQLDGHEYIKKYSDIDWEKCSETGDGIRIQVQMEDGSTLRANRIFKNGIKFVSKVHNYPEVKKVIIDPEFLVMHDRFVQSKEALKIRYEQRDKMIMDYMGNKEDIRSLYYAARQHFDMKRYDEAIIVWKEYLTEINKDKKEQGESQIAEKRKVKFDLAKAYYLNKEYKQALATIADEELMEYMFLRGQMHSTENNHAEAIKEILNALITKPTGKGFQPISDVEFLLYDFLSVSLFYMKQYEMAIIAANKALEYKDDEQVRSNINSFSYELRANKEKDSGYYDQLFKNGYNTSKYKDVYDLIINYLNEYKGSNVLELGCGVGSLGKRIIDEGFTYKGFDFSDEAIKHCPKGNFYKGNVYDKKEYKGDYDTIVATELFEHVDDFKVMELIPSGVRIIGSVPTFGDVAHLRTYDSEKFIETRFKKYLNMEKIYFSEELGIFVFIGIRK